MTDLDPTADTDKGITKFATGYLGTDELQPREREPHTDFRPWHRPRKQFVRKRQWAAETERLIGELPAGPDLRYFGLAGTDLLDVRFLGTEVCAPAGRSIYFCSFNSAAAPDSPEFTRQNVAEQSVKQQDIADARSVVVPDHLKQLGNVRSQAFNVARQHGPYDVINLDLCNGFWNDEPEGPESLYSAMQSLASLQTRRDSPWLLFITSTVGEDSYNEASEAKIVEVLKMVEQDCPPEFELLGLGPDWSLAMMDGPQRLRALVCAVAMWFNGVLQNHVPTRLKACSSFSYRVFPEAGDDDLVSFALRMTPLGAALTDPSGVGGAVGTPVVDNCATLGQLVNKITNTKRVDVLLADDGNLYSSVVEEAADLLESAGYGAEAYRAAVANGSFTTE